MKDIWNRTFGTQKLTLKLSHTMKNKTFISILFLFLIVFGCSAPNYLPIVEEIDINQFGSYIEIEGTNEFSLDGELISIDRSKMVVLSSVDSIKRATILKLEDVNQFTLKYAQPKDYSWRIPVYTLSTLLHGFYLIFTAPINLIVTISVNASGSSDFEYSETDMDFEKLKMFARFPQGLPPNVNIADLK